MATRSANGELAREIARLVGDAVSRTIVQMVMSGELDRSVGVEILRRVEAAIQEGKEQFFRAAAPRN